jgi:muramoyltetrapeptide carboxypeptidase LdcA involved in peptidoglycan recycling
VSHGSKAADERCSTRTGSFGRRRSPRAIGSPRSRSPGERPGAFPHRYDAGARQLAQAFDVEVVPTEHALADPDWIAHNPAARADDLHAALSDRSVGGIVSTIGGDDSIRLLPYLDLDLIRANPKVFLGFSDTTVTHMAFLRAGVASFYGPSILAGFGENTGLLPYLARGVRETLFTEQRDLTWPENADGWTVEHLSWEDPANQERARSLRPTTGWRWLGGSSVEGPFVAGCIEVLDRLRGTAVWPDLDGAVLAIETSEEAPSPEAVARILRSFAASGDPARIVGLLVGRPGGSDLDPATHEDYDAAILRVVRDEQGLRDLPVVAGMDFGHTDPAWTLPIGVPVRIDVDARTVTFADSGVRARTETS